MYSQVGLQDFLLALLNLTPQDVTDTPVEFVALQSLDEVEHSLRQLKAARPRPTLEVRQLAQQRQNRRLRLMLGQMSETSATPGPLHDIRQTRAQARHQVKTNDVMVCTPGQPLALLQGDGHNTPSPGTTWHTAWSGSSTDSISNDNPQHDFIDALEMVSDAAFAGASQAVCNAENNVNERFDGLHAEVAHAARVAKQREGAPSR